MCSGSEAGSHLRLIDSCITQLMAQGPSRTCNESKEEGYRPQWMTAPRFGSRVSCFGCVHSWFRFRVSGFGFTPVDDGVAVRLREDTLVLMTRTWSKFKIKASGFRFKIKASGCRIQV